MNPLSWFDDIKAYLTWGALGVLAIAVGVQTVRVAEADTSLANEQSARATESLDRSRAALRYVEKTGEEQMAHAATQQGISDALNEQTALRQAADANAGQLSKRLRSAFADFAARDRVQAGGDAAAAEHPGDRYEAIDGLFAAAGDLLARSGDLQEKARSLVTRRDSEVQALKAVVDNDRALCAAPVSGSAQQ